MIRFVIRRLLSSIPVALGIVITVFVLARVIPGDPCKGTLGEKATPAQCASFIKREGLDRSTLVQFGKYMDKVIHGDLGDSLKFHRSVASLLGERLPTTLELAVLALVFALLVGIPLGVIAAYRRNTAIDAAAVVTANVGVSMPVFWLGLLLQYFFSITLKGTPLALPPSGRLSAGLIAEPFYKQWGLGKNFLFEFISHFNILNGVLQWNWRIVVDAATHLVLPALALGTIPLALIARMTRSSLLDVLGQDYIRTARAKGLRELLVVRRHALRSALLPVVTVIGLSLGSLIGGAILTETVFGLTGVGKTLFDAIESRDYTVVQGFSLIVGLAFVVVNLITDIIYTRIDPRVRVS